MKGLISVTKGFDKLLSYNALSFDSWFSWLITAEEAITEGVDYCGLVKISHKGFFLGAFEKLINKWSGGSYIFMKINPIFPYDRPLMAIRYKYNSRKFLGFIASKGSGSTESGVPYLYLFPGNYSYVSIWPLFCPNVPGRYFNSYNAIDNPEQYMLVWIRAR